MGTKTWSDPLSTNPVNHADTTPYLLDLQSDLLDVLDSRLVILLRSLKHFAKLVLPTRLAPVLTIEGDDFLLETPKMSAVPQRILNSPVTSLALERDRINAALDFLFQGY